MSNKITVSAFKKGEECLISSLSVEEKDSINIFIRNINGFENSNLDDKHPYATFDNLDDENIGKKFIINELEDLEILLDKSKKITKKSTKKSNKKIDDLINETANLKIDSSDEIKNENNININDISISDNTEIVKSEDSIVNDDIILKEPESEISKIVTTPVLEKKKKGKKSTSKEVISIPSVEQPKVEQPIVDQPKVEQHIIEETKDEQPKIEESSVEQPESDKSEPTVPKKKKATKKAISDEGKEKSETVPKKKSTKKIDTTESADTNEVTVKKVIIRNCSICKTPGHDKRTCPNKAI